MQCFQDEGSDAEFGSYFSRAAAKTWTFQMMAKQDSYNVSLMGPTIWWDRCVGLLTSWQDQVRVRYQCRRAALPDYPTESAHLSQLINQMAF
jgi:replication factor A1